jgi:hypothetical protein
MGLAGDRRNWTERRAGIEIVLAQSVFVFFADTITDDLKRHFMNPERRCR